MDFDLFDRLIRNLLHMDSEHGGDEDALFASFERKYCYNPALQPGFTAEGLARVAAGAQGRSICTMEDDIGVCLALFRLEGMLFLVGPYARREFDQDRVRRALISCGLSASYISSIRLYFAGLPVIGTSSVLATITAFLQSFANAHDEYAHNVVSNARDSAPLPSRPVDEVLDYSSLYTRYDLENTLLRCIEQGDTDNVVAALRNMTLAGMEKYRYTTAIYQNPEIGLAMIRALARKAAERGGASLVEVHRITQETVQGMYAARNDREKVACTDRMVYELAKTVRLSRRQFESFTPPIRKVVDHIQLNYTQRFTLAALAEVAGISESYLTKAFKRDVGTSIFQYIAQLRCQEAARLLKETELPVQQVSSYVGYDDGNYFVKVFKRQYGMTPSEYRARR